jgi:hypothetical protein
MENENGSNSSYQYLSDDYILATFAGSTWLLDDMSFYPFVIFRPIGFFLNILALVIFKHADFDTRLYQYFRVYTANNTIFCLFISFSWLNAAYRITPWGNSEIADALCIYFITNVYIVSYFFGSIVQILIIIGNANNYHLYVNLGLKDFRRLGF